MSDLLSRCRKDLDGTNWDMVVNIHSQSAQYYIWRNENYFIINFKSQGIYGEALVCTTKLCRDQLIYKKGGSIGRKGTRHCRPKPFEKSAYTVVGKDALRTGNY